VQDREGPRDVLTRRERAGGRAALPGTCLRPAVSRRFARPYLNHALTLLARTSIGLRHMPVTCPFLPSRRG
jgi:hypothetical protein